MDGFVNGIVRPLSAYAQQGAGPEEMTRMFCTICRHLIASGSLDARYAERFPGAATPRCMGGSFDERGEALADLSAAARYLGVSEIPRLVPAVKVNMARCLDRSSSRDDVASFPGRLQDVRGNIQQPLPPQFGASKHLADILLEAHEGDASVLAACNIRFTDEIGSIVGSIGIASSVLGRDPTGRITGVREKVRDGCRALADPGHFGIEPCLYLFGRTSLELASLMVEIDGSLEGGR
jgi:hypothetical protein